MGDGGVFSGAAVADDVGSLPYVDQLTRLHELEAALRRLEAEMSVTVAAIADTELFKPDGHRSVHALLRAELKWSEGDILHRVRTGRLLSDLPEVVDALGSGQIGVAQVRAFAQTRANPRCGARLIAERDRLLGEARVREFADFHRSIRRWELLHDRDGTQLNAEAAHEARTARLFERDGVGHLSGQGGAVDTAELLEIWEQFAHAERMLDVDQATAQLKAQGDTGSAALPRTEGQRKWDSLVTIFRTAASRPADSTLPESTLNIVMDETTFHDALAELEMAPARSTPAMPFRFRRSETTSGILVDPVQALQATIWGHVRRVVIDSAGNVVDLGRRRRLFTGAIREAVMLHSPRCIWPGCTTPAGRCDADHHHDWQHGGHTASTNGGPTCPRHGRLKNHGYRVHRDPDGHWHTYRPDGTEIGAQPEWATA